MGEANLTDHQQTWWGLQKCRRCNPNGEPARSEGMTLSVICPDCDGSGWTLWAALATEPWTEVIRNLWIGGHDYNTEFYAGHQASVEAPPVDDRFDVVVSMYRRFGHAPKPPVEHHEFIFPDSQLSAEILCGAAEAARIVTDAHTAGRKVLVRCQAGLNRSSLVAGLAMLALGFAGSDVVQLIRARRSPWALCNEHYVRYLQSAEAVQLVEAAMQ